MVSALIPSAGLGGGIEAYVEAVLEQLQAEGVEVSRHVLRSGGAHRLTVGHRVRFIAAAFAGGWRLRGIANAQILVFHPSFITLALVMRRISGRHPNAIVRAVMYGCETWSAGYLRRWIWRRSPTQFVAISTFTAGALAPRNVRLLPPGIPEPKYEALLRVPDLHFDGGHPIELLSVFRLEDAEGKGAFTILDAVERLRAEGNDIRATFAGTRPSHPRLDAEAGRRPGWVRVVPAPSDLELADLYARSRFVILATRLAEDRVDSGEGYGIVLAEGALAGRAVIGPACDGSADAMLPGITGLQPVDSSVDALTDVLRWCLAHPPDVDRVARNARRWARQQFSPARYRRRVMSVLFDDPVEPATAVALSDGLVGG